jgi:hypothetical protein
VNGEKNTLTLTVENKSDRNVTLLGVSGSLYHPDTDALIKNVGYISLRLEGVVVDFRYARQLTSLNYGIPLVEGVKMNLPYVFYSE